MLAKLVFCVFAAMPPVSGVMRLTHRKPKQEMQNKLFSLGFGPLPYIRRPGALLNISLDEADDDDPSRYRLGCVVAHSGPRGEEVGSRGGGLAAGRCCVPRKSSGSQRCYFCHGNPFVEVLFYNPGQSAYGRRGGGGGGDEDIEEHEDWQTVPVCPRRAALRALPVGTRLVISVATLSKVCFFFPFGR